MGAPQIGKKWGKAKVATKTPQVEGVVPVRAVPTQYVKKMPWERLPGDEPGLVNGEKASSWEMKVAKELERRGVQYQFQVSILGGRRLAGGKILDFVVNTYPLVIIRVQGGWWHEGGAAKNKDALEMMTLKAMYSGAIVIDVYEEHIKDAELLERLLDPVGYM